MSVMVEHCITERSTFEYVFVIHYHSDTASIAGLSDSLGPIHMKHEQTVNTYSDTGSDT